VFRFRLVPRLVALLALVAVLFVTAGSARAATGTIQVGSATLVARGAAVDVPVAVSLTCDEGFDTGLIQLGVSQAQGRTLAGGEGAALVSCRGETQVVTVRVFASSAPFHGGSALASARLLQCQSVGGELFCSPTGIGTSQEFRIRGR
jgi:hypothetical protein